MKLSWKLIFEIPLQGHLMPDCSKSWKLPPLTCLTSVNVTVFVVGMPNFWMASSKSLTNNTPKMVILSLTICVQQQKLLGVSSPAKKRDMDGKITNQWETENKRLRGWCCCFWVDPLKFRTKSRTFGSNRISKRVVFLISLGASLM